MKRFLFGTLLVCITFTSMLARSLTPPGPDKEPTWAEFDKLINEQKFEAASKVAGQLREMAKKKGDDPNWAKTLIEETQLRIALGGYETAVRFLREEAWPKSFIPKATLELFYTNALVTYVQAYSYEIRNREQVESKGPIDLKSWTQDQILQEAESHFAALWNIRAQLNVPVKTLEKFVSPNNYPTHIRGSLRDMISYLAVNHFANSAFWRPEQSQSAYELNVANLLAGTANNINLDDRSVHPLVKISYILSDLENWHTSRGNQFHESALEAHLEKIRRIDRAFTDQDQHAAVKQHLEALLPKYRSVSWWAMGMADLSHLISQHDDDLPHAREVALQGYNAYPNSPGGVACLSAARAIEAPHVTVQSMTVDNLQRRSVMVNHANIEQLYFRAYSFDLLKRLSAAEDYSLFYTHEELKKLVRESQPIASWTETLPKTVDYKPHNTFVTPPLKTLGAYVIVASVRSDFAFEKNWLFGANLIMSDLVITSRPREQGGYDVTVASGKSGQPVAGAEVIVYRYDYRNRHQIAGSKRTDDKGYVRLSIGEFPGITIQQYYFMIARKDKDIGLDVENKYFYSRSRPAQMQQGLLYTDRSIYRPGQKILWKFVAYNKPAQDTKYEVESNRSVTIHLRDANNQIVMSATKTTNSYGSIAGEFTIPPGRILGNWSLQSDSRSSYAHVQVEEYKRPTFEVTFKDPTTPLRLNKNATLSGEARYYFGLPVSTGKVRWRVKRQPIYPDWWYFWRRPTVDQGGIVQTGETELDKTGAFKVNFLPKADEKLGRDVAYSYVVDADITDDGGETRSGSRTAQLGFVTIRASIISENAFFTAANKPQFTVARTDLNGAAKPGAGEWKIFALKQPTTTTMPADLPIPVAPQAKIGFQTAGDKLRPRWERDFNPLVEIASWKDGGEKSHGALVHDAHGNSTLALGTLPAGAYRLRYQSKDDFGAVYQTNKEFVVAETGARVAVPLLLAAEKNSVPVGQKARILVASAIDSPVVYWGVFKNEKLVDQKRLDLHGSTIIELPVSDADRGGFAVAAWTLKDHQFILQNTSISVPWSNKELDLSFETFRDRIRPGTSETWRVKVKGKESGTFHEASAELLAYMYDRSLDFFTAHSFPSPGYPTFSSMPSFTDSLGSSQAQWIASDTIFAVPGGPGLRPDQLKFYSSYGIGGLGHRRGRMYLGRAQEDSIESEGIAAPQPLAMAPMKSVSGAMFKEKKGEAASAREEDRRSADKADANTTVSTPVRSNFSETAFFKPQLLLDAKGETVIEFKVPDSVTSWNVWVHAITRDLMFGSLKKTTESAKELMVRPYLPRFFREGDTAELKVVVNNASDKPLSGNLNFDIVDPETKKSLKELFQLKTSDAPFTVVPKQSTSVAFSVVAPKNVGLYAILAQAKTESFADGELRPVPVLPSRLHLIESRFVTLKDKTKRTMSFVQKEHDPTRVDEKLVITVDGQLFYTVLKSLPYLIEYPYECAEQTLNRFVSTAIVSQIYKNYPAVAKMASDFSARDTQLERFDAPDPNRKMALEESPWLQEAQGGVKHNLPLVNVLDSRIAHAQRDQALDKLAKMQTSLGGFPWFPGGPPSPYMTLYLMYGFAKASEFGVEVPKDMVQRAWGYLARHFREDYLVHLKKKDCCWEYLTFLNYVANAYPDSSYTAGALTLDERKEILDFTFSKWKHHSPYLKALLALTLKRMNRAKDAALVFASIMDSSKTTEDGGTFWMPEDRSWLWYNDNIESHAFTLRALMELAPDDNRRDGLVKWLFLNKKLNQWKSTRATAEVIYSLLHYLKREKTLDIRQSAIVTVGTQQEKFVFEPDKYVGKAQSILEGTALAPLKTQPIVVESQTRGLLFASSTLHFATDTLPKTGAGDLLSVNRVYYKRQLRGKEWVLSPLAEGARVNVGDEVEVQLSIRARHAAEYVHLRDPRGAGFEPVATTSRYKWDLGLIFYEEVRDSGENFFFEQLPQGEYTLKYRLRATTAGGFRVGPATLQSMYAPEFSAYSAGHTLAVKQAY